MYSVKTKQIADQMRNCVVAGRGDWLFNSTLDRDEWFKDNHNISIWRGTADDELVFASEQDYLMFMLKWS